MPADRRPNPPDDYDPGFEGVDPPARPKPPAARPVPAKPVPARPVAAKPVPPAAALTAPPKKPKVQVVEDDVDDAPGEDDLRPRKKKKPRPATEDDRTDPGADAVSDDDRPRKRKRKKKRKGGVEISDGAQNAMAEWAMPVFLMLVGMAMTIVGTVGLASKPGYEVSAPLAAIFMVIGQIISIPITIVCLMVIGSVFGIEYGTLLNAVRSLAAMGLLVNGLMSVFQWIGLPFFVYQPIIMIVGIGLFMSFFELDISETMTTMFVLDAISWVFNIVLWVIIIMVLASGMRQRDKGGNPGGGPNAPGQYGDPDEGRWQPPQKGQKGSGSRQQSPPPASDNDGDDDGK